MLYTLILLMTIGSPQMYIDVAISAGPFDTYESCIEAGKIIRADYEAFEIVSFECSEHEPEDNE